VSVVMAGGAPHPFIVVGEEHTGARKGETTDGNGLNAIEAGRLDEGIKGGGIKRGNQGRRVKTSIGNSMLEAGRRSAVRGDEKKRRRE
jgi:hypothetical protein